MRIRKLAAAAALGAAALGLSACATGLSTQVSRSQAMPIPQGQSFYVVPAHNVPPSLDFNRYAQMVTQALEAKGYRRATDPQLADMVVKLDYGVDEGRTEVVRDPMYGPGMGYGYRGLGYRFGGFGYGYDPFYRGYYDPIWGVYYGRPYVSRFSRYGRRSPFYYGWDDPFWYASPYAGYGYGQSGYGGRIREYTVYKANLDMQILRRVDNAPLFEGQARARSQTDELEVLVPNLIEAMFTGFPGKSGETVRISVPTRKRS